MTKLKPIGIIRTPYKKDRDAPYQAYKSEDVGEIEVFKEYEEGLKDIEGFSHLIILYEFHKSIKRSVKKEHYLESRGLLVKPYLDDVPRGVFATRSPNRPNPIGLTVVELLERKGNILKVKGIDMLDGTPLLDIKPYVPKFDKREKVRIGWLESKL
jgi:tRNA-Thr(GGU) m(6)t(6)A37 methyltransferase TsaA